MTDLTTIFNGLLKQHEASPTRRTFSVDEIDDFLKEAYRIVSSASPLLLRGPSHHQMLTPLILQNTHISTLHTELTSVRRAYLSTAQPRKTPTPHLRKPGAAQQPSQPPQYLTDRQREEIDSNAKTLLRELNASIRALADAEQLRQDTEAALLRKKHARGGLGGALGAWAAGSGATAGKSTEQQVAEDRARQVSAHREAVLWFLRQRLQVCGRTQQDMMEARLMREVERNRSVLAKAGGPSYAEFAALAGVGPSGGAGSGGSDLAASTGSLGSGSGVKSLAVEEEEKKAVRRDDLTPEQIQMFEKGNHDMLKHYESTLDKVRLDLIRLLLF